MMTKRRERLCAVLRRQGLAGMITVPGPNFYYLTGRTPHHSERLTFALVLDDGRLALLLPELERTDAESRMGDDTLLFSYNDKEGAEKALRGLTAALNLHGKQVGVEFRGMWVGEELAIRQAVGANLVQGDHLLTELRIVKDATELAAMRQAVQIVETALAEVLAGLVPGQTEREVAADLQVSLLRHGSGPLPFMPIVVSGPNAALPHASPSDRAIRAGDVVTIDCGAWWKGYASDMTRNAAVGPVAETLERIHRVVEEANAAGRAAARPGTRAETVDAAARDVIATAGYGNYFVHRTGHGLGLEVHEPPYIVEGNRQRLEAGMTFTVEPGIYIPGLGGARVEDDVLITSDGAESLTHLPRQLFRVGDSGYIPNRTSNIVLTGFMGTGKSAAGREVARRLGRTFVDMDEEIATEEGRSIAKLFATQGEAYFRQRETALCRELAEGEGLVIATGGGALIPPQNRALLGRNGVIICLTASVEEILNRLDDMSDRPLLATPDRRAKVESLLAERAPAYASIPYQLDTTRMTVEQVAEAVLSIVERKQ